MAKMTLKQMNEQAKELNMAGYETAEAIFRHGLHSLMSSQESLKADRENPIKYQKELDTLEQFFPEERKQCELIWKPLYDEYRRIGYRLKQ